MLSEAKADGTRRTSSSAFWWRLTDNLFRRLGWFLLPVIVLTTVGVMQARNTLELYVSSGTLSASSNPLVPETDVRGVSRNFYETPAGSTSRIINERLRTDSFLLDVIDAAGLTEQLEGGLFGIDVVRASVSASARGDNILTVRAQWADPQVAHNLASSTIDQYQQFINDTVVSDSVIAEDYYTQRLSELEQERVDAETALDDFISAQPPLADGADYSPRVLLEIDRLSSAINLVETKIVPVQEAIDVSVLARATQSGETGRSLTVIDVPKVPSFPDSTLVGRATTVLAHFMLGMIIAVAALVITTALDKTVSSPADLLAIDGVVLVATVPRVRLSHADAERRRWRRRKRRPRVVAAG